MRPLSFSERFPGAATVSLDGLLSRQVSVEGGRDFRLADYVREITASGFPGIRALNPRGQRLQLDAYIENVIHREFAQQGQSFVPTTLCGAGCVLTPPPPRRQQATRRCSRRPTPGEGAKPAKTTAIAHRDVLSSLWLLEELHRQLMLEVVGLFRLLLLLP